MSSKSYLELVEYLAELSSLLAEHARLPRTTDTDLKAVEYEKALKAVYPQLLAKLSGYTGSAVPKKAGNKSPKGRAGRPKRTTSAGKLSPTGAAKRGPGRPKGSGTPKPPKKLPVPPVVDVGAKGVQQETNADGDKVGFDFAVTDVENNGRSLYIRYSDGKTGHLTWRGQHQRWVPYGVLTDKFKGDISFGRKASKKSSHSRSH